MDILRALAVFLICYVIGSFPTAYIIGRLNGINIFNFGSGNMGTNNTIRAVGLGWGAVCWVIDVSKGIVAVLLARLLMPSEELLGSIIGAIAVVIGHNWSFFAGLITGTIRGGKGAATAAGTWLMLVPVQIFVVTLFIWGLVVLSTRYVSLAVLVAFGVGTAWILILSSSRIVDPVYSVYVVIVSALVYIRHSENIRALIAGKERRFSIGNIGARLGRKGV